MSLAGNLEHGNTVDLGHEMPEFIVGATQKPRGHHPALSSFDIAVQHVVHTGCQCLRIQRTGNAVVGRHPKAVFRITFDRGDDQRGVLDRHRLTVDPDIDNPSALAVGLDMLGEKPGDALVFGCETKGLPPELLEANADRCLRIPTRAETRSLNLSVSVGIVAYEARRQIDKS